jgi:hypothetical protein
LAPATEESAATPTKYSGAVTVAEERCCAALNAITDINIGEIRRTVFSQGKIRGLPHHCGCDDTGENYSLQSEHGLNM